MVRPVRHSLPSGLKIDQRARGGTKRPSRQKRCLERRCKRDRRIRFWANAGPFAGRLRERGSEIDNSKEQLGAWEQEKIGTITHTFGSLNSSKNSVTKARENINSRPRSTQRTRKTSPTNLDDDGGSKRGGGRRGLARKCPLETPPHHIVSNGLTNTLCEQCQGTPPPSFPLPRGWDRDGRERCARTPTARVQGACPTVGRTRQGSAADRPIGFGVGPPSTQPANAKYIS